MGSFVDLVGQRFGRLIVSRRAANRGKQTAWVCACDCGGTTEAMGQNLKRGLTASCGCLRREYEAAPTKPRRIHGHASDGAPTRTYISYRAMVARTTNPDHKSWANYGGKGIRVCDRWLHGESGRTGFECFLLDMGLRPSRTTIDRIKGDADYEPRNCRWASPHTQASNKRSAKLARADVEDIRAALASGEPRKAIADRLGIHQAYVGQIERGERRARG